MINITKEIIAILLFIGIIGLVYGQASSTHTYTTSYASQTDIGTSGDSANSAKTPIGDDGMIGKCSSDLMNKTIGEVALDGGKAVINFVKDHVRNLFTYLTNTTAAESNRDAVGRCIVSGDRAHVMNKTMGDAAIDGAKAIFYFVKDHVGNLFAHLTNTTATESSQV